MDGVDWSVGEVGDGAGGGGIGGALGEGDRDGVQVSQLKRALQYIP